MKIIGMFISFVYLILYFKLIIDMFICMIICLVLNVNFIILGLKLYYLQYNWKYIIIIFRSKFVVGNRVVYKYFNLILGDNVDVYVRISLLNRERRNKDLYLFVSNIIFSRIVIIDMFNIFLGINVEQFKSEYLLMIGMEKVKFLSVCSVFLVRILCKIFVFENLKK